MFREMCVVRIREVTGKSSTYDRGKLKGTPFDFKFQPIHQ